MMSSGSGIDSTCAQTSRRLKGRFCRSGPAVDIGQQTAVDAPVLRQVAAAAQDHPGRPAQPRLLQLLDHQVENALPRRTEHLADLEQVTVVQCLGDASQETEELSHVGLALAGFTVLHQPFEALNAD